jgi:hypothetical protein
VDAEVTATLGWPGIRVPTVFKTVVNDINPFNNNWNSFKKELPKIIGSVAFKSPNLISEL